jgi:hypothetical protein
VAEEGTLMGKTMWRVLFETGDAMFIPAQDASEAEDVARGLVVKHTGKWFAVVGVTQEGPHG